MSKGFWEIKQSATSKTIELYIYSNVQGDTYDWWTGETTISDTSATFFRDELAKCGELDNINIYINSLGGSVMEGVAIYNQLRRHKAHKTVYIDGFACSIASVIAMAGDKIVMPANATMMIHNAWTSTSGNAAQLRKTADDLDKINESSRQAYLQKAQSKISEEKLSELLDAETYLTAAECIECGFADEYAEKDVDLNFAKQMLEKSKQEGINHYTAKLEKICALAEKPPEKQINKNEAFNAAIEAKLKTLFKI